MVLLKTGLARQSRDPQELQDYSPVPLFVGHIVWTEEIQLVLADDTDVDVAARAQVIVDAGCDGISHELLGLLLLEWLKSCHCPSAGHFPGLCIPVPAEVELGTINDTPNPSITRYSSQNTAISYVFTT